MTRDRSRPTANQAAQALTQRTMTVTVSAVDYTTSKVMVRDRTGTEVEIDATLRLKGTGMPAVGEQWALSRRGTGWGFDYQIGAQGAVSINGSRAGMHPVASQMLDALIAQGLLVDETYGLTFNDVLDTTTNDSFVPDTSVEPWNIAEETDITDDPQGVDYIPPGGVPVNANGPAGPDPVTGVGGKPPPKVGGKKTPAPTPAPSVPSGPIVGPKWIPIYVVSANEFAGMGPQKAYADIVRLTNTRANLIGLQEMSDRSRDWIFPRLQGHGWSYYRPAGTGKIAENTLMWRTGDFDELDHGVITMSNASGVLHSRYFAWVKLFHKPSQRVIRFGGTHLHEAIERGGRPKWGPDPTRLNQTFSSIDQIRQLMIQWAADPFYFVGDMNMDWYAVARARYPRFPAVKWTSVGGRPNWAVLGHTTIPSLGSRYIDQVWMVNGKRVGTKFVDQWVLTGQNSDHHPVLVKTEIHSNNHKR